MRDDGRNGDLKRGDHVFSLRLTINELSVGQMHYRVSAAFKRVLQRVLSSTVVVYLDPFPLPPDPGEAGKQTLAGVDSDADGIRDDIQRFIALSASNDQQRMAMTKYARAMQEDIIAPTDETPNARAGAIRCLIFVFGPSGAESQSARLLSKMLNTDGRIVAWKSAATDTPPTLGPIRESELGAYCGN